LYCITFLSNIYLESTEIPLKKTIMKSKLLVLSLIMLFTLTTNAQVSSTQAGIAVQGIARDADNTAMANRKIPFTFTIYYLDASNNEQPIYDVTQVLETDTFGVFSYVINQGAVNSSKIANTVSYLRIKNESTTISNEKFNHVPYAISANNGVPTGSIMPFIGVDAPYGWALCNGNPLPTDGSAAALIAILGGSNTPKLQGMFLRGTGKSSVNNQKGPDLRGTQGDVIKNHEITITDPEHKHGYKDIYQLANADRESEFNFSSVRNQPSASYPPTNNAFDTERISDSVATGITAKYDKGGNETRPVSYGVNYIIKL
jgi:microcystin-dependent protein